MTDKQYKAIMKALKEQTARLIADPVALAKFAERQRKDQEDYEAYMNLPTHEGNCHCARCMAEFEQWCARQK